MLFNTSKPAFIYLIDYVDNYCDSVIGTPGTPGLRDAPLEEHKK